MQSDPTGKYLYYVPGAHGGAVKDGTPVVQYDVKTGKRKVLAFLYDYYWKKYAYAPDGIFCVVLDQKGERLFIGWDGLAERPAARLGIGLDDGDSYSGVGETISAAVLLLAPREAGLYSSRSARGRAAI